ncbi:filamentous hemagglutinin N-terminal domain-containing protein [Vibrio sp. Isolate23]|uniref:filamentous hemagglutinin N-terminal domain-containing protein n=1 Tax=Vibrio sp. Isolate23 TaxID=2908533 RepID=UPI001EFCA511|nr:filamentous hemagglutinin N-terminal domain-containing protein [Vibrio sp. Isolate23]
MTLLSVSLTVSSAPVGSPPVAWPNTQCALPNATLVDGVCQSSFKFEPHYTCPANASLNHSNARCYGSENKPMVFSCPSGYNLIDGKKGKECEKVLFSEACKTFNTPFLIGLYKACLNKTLHTFDFAWFKDTDIVYSKTPEPMYKKVDTKRPTLVCPRSFKPSGGYCRKNTTAAAQPVCASNQTLGRSLGFPACIENRKLPEQTSLKGYIGDGEITPSTQLESTAIYGQSENQLLMIDAGNQSNVSHMRFEHFNQDEKRLSLVNNPKLNSNLAEQAPPQLIVIEHTGIAPMVLGKIEVLGRAADLLFISQAGVICQSCQFSNTQRVTIATGDAEFDRHGALTSISTNQGEIQVRGTDGLITDDALMVTLLANRVNLDGPISTLAKAHKTIDGEIVLDPNGELIASQGNVQIIAGRVTHNYSTSNNQVDVVENSVPLIVKYPIDAGSVWLQTTNQYSDIVVENHINTKADITVLSDYQTHQGDESRSQLLLSNGNIHIQSFATITLKDATLSTSSNVNLQGQNVRVRPLDSFKAASIKAGLVNVAAEFEFESQGLLSADEIKVAAKFVNNIGGELIAVNSLYINGEENINNYNQGLLAASDVTLVSKKSITNGWLEGFQCEYPENSFDQAPTPLSNSEGSLTNKTSSRRSSGDIHINENQIQLGTASGLAANAQKKCAEQGKVVSEIDVDNRRSLIIGFNIAMQAPNVLNVNPQLKKRSNVRAANDAPIVFDLKDTFETLISAENNLYIEASNSFKNVSSALEVLTGNLSVRAPRVSNERYFIESSTNVDKSRPHRDTHIKETTQYVKSLSPPPYLLVGGNFYIDGGRKAEGQSDSSFSSALINEAGSVEVLGTLAGNIASLRSLGLVTQARVDRRVTHHHAERYCSRRVFRKCISHKIRRWTTTSFHVDKNQINGQLISLFDIQRPNTEIQGLLATGDISYGKDF